MFMHYAVTPITNNKNQNEVRIILPNPAYKHLIE